MVYLLFCFLGDRRPDIVTRKLSLAVELIVRPTVWWGSRIGEEGESLSNKLFSNGLVNLALKKYYQVVPITSGLRT